MNSKNPFFSVVIPSYNREKILPKALEGVLQQTFSDFEIIIIDNGSTDGTAKVIRGYDDSRIRYVFQKGSGSPANPRNQGMKQARALWIALLDSDDGWELNKLQRIHEVIQKYPEVDVFCHYELMKNQSNGKNTVLTHGQGRDMDDMYRSMLLDGNCLSPSATVLRRSFIEQKQLYFNESPDFAIVEDYDLWLRIANAGAKFHFIPEALGEYTVNGENMIGDWPRYIKNLRHLMRYHTFEVQSFEKNTPKLWHHFEAQLAWMDAYHALQDKTYSAFISNAMKSAIYDPRWFMERLKRKLVS
ncbi:MAG: glycosyltransferase [SAR324 cluster bacterium]|nr:glycosyltransferase [SAR324 cluster bacterium]MBF0351736.1 glycosyltransferase [SAR324 cluster bacterium]